MRVRVCIFASSHRDRSYCASVDADHHSVDPYARYAPLGRVLLKYGPGMQSPQVLLLCIAAVHVETKPATTCSVGGTPNIYGHGSSAQVLPFACRTRVHLRYLES